MIEWNSYAKTKSGFHVSVSSDGKKVRTSNDGINWTEKVIPDESNWKELFFDPKTEFFWSFSCKKGAWFISKDNGNNWSENVDLELLNEFLTTAKPTVESSEQ